NRRKEHLKDPRAGKSPLGSPGRAGIGPGGGRDPATSAGGAPPGGRAPNRQLGPTEGTDQSSPGGKRAPQSGKRGDAEAAAVQRAVPHPLGIGGQPGFRGGEPSQVPGAPPAHRVHHPPGGPDQEAGRDAVRRRSRAGAPHADVRMLSFQIIL
ncbi:hypothetical protein AVEN_210678-1, partial [Araneus ventricosus]